MQYKRHSNVSSSRTNHREQPRMTLPPHNDNQAYCDVSALEAGHLDILDEIFITGAVPGKVTTVPSLAFLIRHSTNGKKFLFDLGIRKDWDNYPPVVVEWIKNTFPTRVDQDVVESLAKGGISPGEIDYICLSHCHWDHTGDTSLFTNSTFLVGGACKALFDPGFPNDPNGLFAADLLPESRTIFYDTKEWKSVGPFPRALDFFEDGSLFIIDSPGHLPGHVNLLVRTSPDGGWIYLAGDSAHHRNLITLESSIAVGTHGFPGGCAHVDKDAAEANIARIHEFTKLPRTRVLLAHDEPFYSKNQHGPAFWPGKIASL